MDELLTKEEILHGLPAGRARTLLSLIESKAAYGMTHAQQAMNIHLTEEGERRRDLAFLEAFTLNREPPLHPRIQDLERFVPIWKPLVPENALLRAAIAHALGAKYRVVYRSVPQIRRVLGLDTEAVQVAYSVHYGQPLSAIYADHETLVERLRWAQSALAVRLESLPPFWTAFALTLTETVGAGVLALPIAMATVSPLAGVVLLVVLGLVNVLTIAAMSESVTRTGSVRYGNAYFGRVVDAYLGGMGSLVTVLANVVLNAVSLLAYFVGFSRVMSDVSHLPDELWAAVLFLFCLYFLTRGSMSSTITSALVIGGINLLILLTLSFLALSRLQPQYLFTTAIPLTKGQPFNPQVLELIFGVILVAYCGHNSVGNCGRIVLRRDPGGRSLILGTVAAILVSIILYCLWTVAVQSAVAPGVMAGYPGTSLELLATAVGPVVRWLGTIYAILAIAMVSVHVSLALFNTVLERLPEIKAEPHVSPHSLVAQGHFLLGLLPVLVLFVIAEWLLYKNTETFAGLIAVGGMLGASIFTGIFPILLLAASRRKGEMLPAVFFRIIGHPLLLWMVYLLFLSGIWLHGFVIWQNPWQRLAAILCGLLALMITLLSVKKGAFNRRLVLQFRKYMGEEQGEFSVVASGEAVKAVIIATTDRGEAVAHAASGQVPDAALLRCLTFQLDKPEVDEVKVWAYRVTPDGTSEPLPAHMAIHSVGGAQLFSEDLSKGPVLAPWNGETGCIELEFRTRDKEAILKTERRNRAQG